MNDIVEYARKAQELNPDFWITINGQWNKPLGFKIEGEGNNRFIVDKDCSIQFGCGYGLNNVIQLITILDMVSRQYKKDYKLLGFGESEVVL